MRILNGNRASDAVGRPAFASFLRSGRWIAEEDQSADQQPSERKYNHNHDPRNGRFTFAPGGGGSTNTNISLNVTPIRASQAAAAGARRAPSKLSKFSPLYPANHTVLVVKRGDTLTKIAAARRGLRIEDLAELNDMNVTQTIRPGQQIKLPNQSYLDAGRAAKDKFLKIEYYRQAHGGVLPPDLANPPEILDPVNWTHESRNGYDFALDAIARTRRVTGTITLNPDQSRSRLEQRRAGGTFRRPQDDGGHYIAREFNGPTEAFNHFAQDRNFNRSDYRRLELRWRQATSNGNRVSVEIQPIYNGTSLRPSSIRAIYYIGGHRETETFPNKSRGK
jgi:LysM repeat protein